MQKIKKGDNVVVLAGKDKGQTGKVLQVMPKEDRAVVQGVNMVKKHQRPNPQLNRPGGIIEKEMPLPICKVAIWNPSTKKADRIGFRTLADGKKVRVFKSTGEMLET